MPREGHPAPDLPAPCRHRCLPCSGRPLCVAGFCRDSAPIERLPHAPRGRSCRRRRSRGALAATKPLRYCARVGNQVVPIWYPAQMPSSQERHLHYFKSLSFMQIIGVHVAADTPSLLNDNLRDHLFCHLGNREYSRSRYRKKPLEPRSTRKPHCQDTSNLYRSSFADPRRRPRGSCLVGQLLNLQYAFPCRTIALPRVLFRQHAARATKVTWRPFAFSAGAKHPKAYRSLY